MLTKRDVIRTVSQRWDRIYNQQEPGFRLLDGRDPSVIGARLKALDLGTCSENAVTEIIGHCAWTNLPCSGCGGLINKVASLKMILLCERCAKEALEQFDTEG